MCGIVNRPSATTCECGHDFENVTHLETLLRSRRQTGWTMVIGGLVLTVGAVSLMFFVGWFFVFGIAAAAGVFTKGTRIVDAASRGLRDVPQLPAAREVKRRDR